jgi:hypothetical protein
VMQRPHGIGGGDSGGGRGQGAHAPLVEALE